MRRFVRENAPWALLAAAGCAACGWMGLYGFAWNDYEVEAKPAFDALAHWHLLAFLRLAPSYGGSLIERAPFALLPDLWGGGQLALYRAVAVPGLLATAALAVWLAARMRTAGGSWFARAVTVLLCTASPIAVAALEQGHAEELVGGVLCVAAVTVAARARAGRRGAIAAGALLGLALANKDWAIVAVGPVLLALPTSGTRARIASVGACLASAGAVAALVLAPLLLVSGAFAAGTRGVASDAGTIFQPWQLWWFFGWHGALRHGLFGIALPGYRTGPAWAQLVSHPLVVLVAIAVAGGLWWRRRGRALTEHEALFALALVLLLRCMLDTWDTGYYMLPCLLALLSSEVTRSPARAPILTLVMLVAPWYLLEQLSEGGARPDAQAALFLAWTLALLAWMASRAYSATGLALPSSPEQASLARSSQAVLVASAGEQALPAS